MIKEPEWGDAWHKGCAVEGETSGGGQDGKEGVSVEASVSLMWSMHNHAIQS